MCAITSLSIIEKAIGYCCHQLPLAANISCMTLRLRSLLFMPADSPRKIAKSAILPADAIIADLEDALAPSCKEEARASLVASLQALPAAGTTRCIRINAVTSTFWLDDLIETFVTLPQVYVVPKVESAADVQAVSERLAWLEGAASLGAGSVRLLAIVETARGVMNIGEIAGADRRLVALALGAEDFVSDVGAQRTREGWEILYARGALVTAAAACGLQAIDTVYTDLSDEAGLAAECEAGRKMGFRGKLAVHPRQLEIINRAFTPSQSEVETAQRLITAFAMQQQAGRGVFVFEGKMVDRPMVRAAQDVLTRAGVKSGS